MERRDVAVAWEELGLTSQDDFLRMAALTDAIQGGSSIAAADLEWLVTLLETTPEVIVRSKVMVMLGAARPALFPLEYREKLNAVLAPRLNSDNKLDRMSAAHLHRTLNAAGGDPVG